MGEGFWGSLGTEAEDMGALDCLSQKFPLWGPRGGQQLKSPAYKAEEHAWEANNPLIQSLETRLKQAHPLPSLPFPSWLCSEATQQAGQPIDQRPCPESSEYRAKPGMRLALLPTPKSQLLLLA